MMSSVAFKTPGSNGDGGPKAPQACLSCRKQKRKCNKALPACALCERMGRPCDYSEASPAPTSDDFNALRAKLFELESRLNGTNGSGSVEHSPYMPTPGSTLSGNSDTIQGQNAPQIFIQQDPAYQNVVNRFPAIAFLDQEAFKYGGISIPKPTVDIPLEVLELLGDGLAVQAVITDFFNSIHSWMPIISKKRLTRNMLNPMWEAGPDLALLFLCMKLMITRPQEGLENPQNPLYNASRRFIALIEANGLISIMVLQAYVLIALYEMGQGIYPAAWMTVGTSARYGTFLGLNDQEFAPQLLPLPATWTEAEERKRTWFGVIIVDRMVAIGSMGLRPLCCEDPSDDVKLPVDTVAWDEGQMTTSPTLNGTSGLTELTFPFARLCQASIYLGRVLQHHHTSRRLPESDRFRQASDLYLKISALTQTIAAESSASQDYLSLSAPLAICFASLSTLCDPYACTEHAAGHNSSNTVEEASMQVQAIEGLKSVSASVKEFAEQIIARTPHSLDVDRVSPFIMDALYSAAANYAWLVRESGDEDCQVALERIRHCLRRLGGRWKTALEFVRVLEAQEFTYAIGSHVA